MKLTTLLLALLILSSKSNAQISHLFNSESFERRSDLEDSIKAIFPGRAFARDSLMSFNSYGFSLTDSAQKKVSFSFVKFMKGENKDLEIKGTPSILKVEVYGSYLDLFLIWKTYINKDANKEELQKRGSERKNTSAFGFWFNKSDDKWRIETMFQPI